MLSFPSVFKRRFQFLMFWVMALPAVALLIWGPRADAPAPPGFVVVDYWEKWTGNEAAMMKLIVDDFNQSVGKDKKIFVRYLSMTNVDRKTLVATAAGVPPDVAGLWDPQVVQFAAQNALEPLEDRAAAYGITSAIYKPCYWQGINYKGHLWALISTPSAMALHYNKRIFMENAAKLRDAGLDPTRAPRTLDELDRYAQVLTVFEPALLGGKKRIGRSGYMPLEPGWYIDATCYFFGGSLFDPATQRFTLDTPPNIAAYEWIAGYSKRLGRESMVEFRSGIGTFDSTQNSFMTGRQVMEQQGPWMANTIFNRNPDMCQALVPWVLEQHLPRIVRPFNYDFGVAPFPSAVTGLEDVTAVGFDALVIPRGAKHPTEAFEFIAYVNRQEVMEKLCALHCKLSPLAKVSENFIRTHPNPYVDVFERLSRSPNAHGVIQIPILAQVAEEMRVMTESVYQMSKTPGQSLHDAQEAVTAKWDEYRRLAEARPGSDNARSTAERE